MKKLSASYIAFILLLAGLVSFTMTTETVSASLTFYVGGTGPSNYTTIQSAIDNATAGDFIFVYNGTYYENLVVDKQLTLVGEDKNLTIVDGNVSVNDVVFISANWVNITDFTIQNPSSSTSGIKLNNVQNCHIFDNIILNNRWGICLTSSNNNTIENNTAILNVMDGFISFSSNNNTFINNNASENNGDGFHVQDSDNNEILNNQISGNSAFGLHLDSSDGNLILNNNISSNGNIGVLIYYSKHETIRNNTMFENSIVIDGKVIQNWNTHQIDSTNNVNNKPVYYWKNKTSGTIPSDAGEVILANCSSVIVEKLSFYDCDAGIQVAFSTNITVANNTMSNIDRGLTIIYSTNNSIENNVVDFTEKGAIFISYSDNNTIYKNNCSSNPNALYIFMSNINIISSNSITNNQDGLKLFYSSNNTVFQNTITSNDEGIFLLDAFNNTIFQNTIASNNDGIFLLSASNNLIYHNNLLNNTIQAFDIDVNFWDNGYPSGGNYWSDYNGIDINSTPTQDVPPPDGIGDTPYVDIQGGVGAHDNYPLMEPWTAPKESFNISLSEGWNLISTPLIQRDESIEKVLENITGKWNVVKYYDSTDAGDPWKTYRPGTSTNDLARIDHTMGFWINITEPDVILTVSGLIPESTSIPLYAGWNLVGYPTLNDSTPIWSALWGTGADRVEICNLTEPYLIKEASPTYIMKPGEGYWVHVPADTIWFINW